MYADYLILDTAAFRKSARNICFFFEPVYHLSGQYPNQNKAETYIPQWFNTLASSRIFNILNFKLGKSPFTHLGVLISPKRLAISLFDSMINRMNMEVAEWGKTKISKADKSVIINSILMATPIYYLSVYPIPDSVITKLSRIARKFLWANCDQGNSMPLVN